ncbi:DUF3120 domain-containing protein [Tumidithrix helvetica PCC 7403]|uniref:DUF3120 domain-containing protein n=1 Tax=Tumidithrix helvetica TaxID=3457545 RepID=UPI003CA517CD
MFLYTTGTNALEEAFPEEEKKPEQVREHLLPEESINLSSASLSSLTGVTTDGLPLLPFPPASTLAQPRSQSSRSLHWKAWLATVFLVSAPVFFEAPLVRFAPWLSIVLTVGWLSISRQLRENPKNQLWGSLLWGFSLTWFCGAIYWGWLRSEPSWHLPIEAIALPWAIWAVSQTPNQSQYRIGGWFYIGSLFGTGVTDLYFYLVNLFPHWRAIMQVETDPAQVQSIFQSALSQVQTSWGMGWALGLAAVLLLLGSRAMRSKQVCYWAFAGAVFGTIFVDLLFAFLAYFA